MSYREWAPPPAHAALVRCTWTQRAVAGGVKRVAPDGCVDLIWTGEGLDVAGPDTGPRFADLAAGTTLVGLRLRPGAAGAVLGRAAAGLRDGDAPLADAWGDDARRLEAALASLPAAAVRAALLATVAARGAEPDAVVAEAVRRLDAPGVRVDRLAAGLFVSERQLRRRFDAAVGYSPRVLARVLRLQRLRELDPAAPLARRAVDAGYADQAHMGTDVRRLVGLTPGVWLPR